jgi:hypothetical protein
MSLKFLYDIIVTKITLTKIVLVANAHAGPSNNARPAFEMTAIALPARYALKPQLLRYTHTMILYSNPFYSIITTPHGLCTVQCMSRRCLDDRNF